MPKISHHWVRLTDEQLAYIENVPEQYEGESDEAHLARLSAWADRTSVLIEDGLETW